MSEAFEFPPYSEVLTDSNKLMTGGWVRWFSLFVARVLGSVQQIGAAVVSNAATALSASVPLTTLFNVTQTGMYRVSWYLQITVADGVSSSAQLSIRWRSMGVTLTKTFTALTGDTTTTNDGGVWPFHADSGTPVTYSIAYASNTPAKMRFIRDLSGEQLS